MKASPFATLVQRFFTEHLLAQRNLSVHTLRSYRQTFRLLLRFLAQSHRRAIDDLGFGEFTAASILAFLDDLERTRRNSIHTRNVRLAAVRSFARFVLGESAPDMLANTQRLLSIPNKRCAKSVLGFMTRSEIAAVIASIDTRTRSGQRDHLFFSLLYNTGARVSELLQLQAADFEHRRIHLRGKGRKNRIVPIWPQNARRLAQWCREQRLAPPQLVFVNRFGTGLTREGIAFRLKLAVAKAAQHLPSLQQRTITPHTFRHTAAMHLLQAGTPLEIIALWMGHSSPATTHGYIEADLTIKNDCMRRLDEPRHRWSRKQTPEHSHLLAFLETR
jgi:integrase/recombinase XerD